MAFNSVVYLNSCVYFFHTNTALAPVLITVAIPNQSVNTAAVIYVAFLNSLPPLCRPGVSTGVKGKALRGVFQSQQDCQITWISLPSRVSTMGALCSQTQSRSVI